ncbi:hypothetical protein [Variovorax saccharolyticus]|uniref:hypothetical protein n=1 Tax=Variovorax saccharolyticus TaxID=3053516 RepID=UPI002574FF87|nr:hypothetical protein [Variovorax sp. J31P216]MDM0025915.1 hypothetical protein [Variovorax sp. J31P216]
MNTMEDLAAAQANVKHWGDAYANDRSNNPDKFAAQRRDAAAKLRQIERSLKQQGLIEKTAQELLDEELDGLYPNAKSKTMVTHQGKKYQVRYFPIEQSRSRKTVKEWGHSWDVV